MMPRTRVFRPRSERHPLKYAQPQKSSSFGTKIPMRIKKIAAHRTRSIIAPTGMTRGTEPGLGVIRDRGRTDARNSWGTTDLERSKVTGRGGNRAVQNLF